jgi:hypothetical protein
MKKIVVVALAVLLAVAAQAQFRGQKSSIFDPSELVSRPTGILSGLLDPSKFSMTHSYTLSYLGIGGRGYNQGLYLNTMTYRFSDPLWAQVAVGYLHQPLGGPGVYGNRLNNKVFIERATVHYQPLKNTLLRIDYRAMPYNPYANPYYDPYSTRW